MFTGIVEAKGQIESIQVNSQGARVTIAANQLDMSDVNLGDSIATNGVCLTVVDFSSHSYSADVSTETLKCTGFMHYRMGQQVNLEKAMLPTTRFGGHMVSGHVDAVVKIISIENKGNSIDYWMEMPEAIAPYITEKGSITIDGTSLTVNGVSNDAFRLTIVPHTTEQTIINTYQAGTSVNVEVDLVARYIERLLLKQPSSSDNTAQSGGVTETLLMRSGFIK